MKNKHTPGPWEVKTIHNGEGWHYQIQGEITETGAGIVADGPLKFEKIPAVPHATYDHQMANARLIAAAPDLLERLEVTLAALEEYMGADGRAENARFLELSRAAIAKARGEK